MILDGGRFAPAQPIVIKEDFSEIRFQLEREALAKTALLSLQSLPQGDYIIRSAGKQVTQFKTTPLCETSVELKTDGTLQGSSFSILRSR